MRLLELRDNSPGIDSKAAAVLQTPARKFSGTDRTTRQPAGTRVPPAAARVFPLNGHTDQPPLRRRPAIDIEQLQQRIDLLERRIQARLANQQDATRRDDIAQLRERLKLLERKLETELWAARQREYALLELLARHPRKPAFKQRLQKILRAVPGTTARWLRAAGKEWWLDSQPLWWPKFSAAWQEAIHRARNS